MTKKVWTGKLPGYELFFAPLQVALIRGITSASSSRTRFRSTGIGGRFAMAASGTSIIQKGRPGSICTNTMAAIRA